MNFSKLLQALFIIIFFALDANAQKSADCIRAKEICKKGNHTFENLKGEGNDDIEAYPAPCFIQKDPYGNISTSAGDLLANGNPEKNSMWLKFIIKKGGTFKFTLNPLRSEDDLDFVVYKTTAGDCKTKKVIRCMAAGDHQFPSYCLGATGLRDGETDVSEVAGCAGDNNNFLKPIVAKEGDILILLVSNVTSAGQGFRIRVGGTCILPCEEERKKEDPKPEAVAPPKENPPVVQAPPPPLVKEETPAVVQAPVSKLPEAIEGRKTVITRGIEVQSRRINLKVWDNSIEDGDIISIYINGKKKYANIYLTTKPQEFLIDLEPGENFITAHVESFGKKEPNTAAISVSDGKREQKLTLNATRKQEETMRVIVQ